MSIGFNSDACIQVFRVDVPKCFNTEQERPQKSVLRDKIIAELTSHSYHIRFIVIGYGEPTTTVPCSVEILFEIHGNVSSLILFSLNKH